MIASVCKCAAIIVNECATRKVWLDGQHMHDVAKVNDCTTGDWVALASNCKCAAGATTGECLSGIYCWIDNTCDDAAKVNDCPTSDVMATPSDCKCTAGATTQDCASGKYCWTDNTCNDAAKTTTDVDYAAVSPVVTQVVDGFASGRGLTAIAFCPIRANSMQPSRSPKCGLLTLPPVRKASL